MNKLSISFLTLLIALIALLSLTTAATAHAGASGKIAFGGTPSVKDIYGMNVDGTNIVDLTNGAGANLYPSFSSDGMQIVFTSTRIRNHEVFTMNVDGTTPMNFSNNALDDYDASWISVAVFAPPTTTPPPTDVLSRKQLRVEAFSSSATVTLQAYVT